MKNLRWLAGLFGAAAMLLLLYNTLELFEYKLHLITGISSVVNYGLVNALP